MQFIIHGLYKVKDRYFSDFGKGYWVDNKQENRPYYYLFIDPEGIMWMIPLSSQVENYKRKIQQEEEKRGTGNCIYYHIGIVASKECVFLIGDMFPVTPKYIRAPFLIDKHPYIIKNKKQISKIHTKATKYLQLVESGVMKSRNDILGIKRQLLKQITTESKSK